MQAEIRQTQETDINKQVKELRKMLREVLNKIVRKKPARMEGEISNQTVDIEQF